MHTDANRFYEILDVDPAASDKAIRLAFRRRAKELHPDAPTGDAAAFILLKRAYDTLSDRNHRAEYDRSCQPPPPIDRPMRRPPLPPMPPSRFRPRRQGGPGIARYVVAFLIIAAISIGGVQAMISFTEAPPSIRTRDTVRSDPAPAAEPAAEAPSGPGSTKSGFWDPAPAPAPRKN